MERFYEKRNCGIPVLILNILAYLIGYSLTQSLASTLLIAVLFAIVVFSLQFDERVKNAVKNSYIVAAFFLLIYLAFDLFSSFISIFNNGSVPSHGSLQDSYFRFNFIPGILSFIYTYGLIFANIAVAVIFGLFILMTVLKKDVDLAFVKRILGEAHPPVTPPYGQRNDNTQITKPSGQQAAPQAPTQQEAMKLSGQQMDNPQVTQPVGEKPVPQAPVHKPGACPNCGKVNISGAKFCGTCGTKLK